MAGVKPGTDRVMIKHIRQRRFASGQLVVCSAFTKRRGFGGRMWIVSLPLVEYRE